MNLALNLDKILLTIAAPIPRPSAKTIENIPYSNGTLIDKSLTNWAIGPSTILPLFWNSLTVSSAKKVSYAIAIPTNSNNIANIVLNYELSTLSPIFWPICTPIIEPKIKTTTKIKSMVP